jgi:hypothetical protein
MFRPYIKGLPITATTLSRHSNGDFASETIRPTYEDYYTLQFKDLYRCLVENAPVKTTVLDCKSLPSIKTLAYFVAREDIVLTGQICQALAEGFDRRQRTGKV